MLFAKADGGGPAPPHPPTKSARPLQPPCPAPPGGIKTSPCARDTAQQRRTTSANTTAIQPRPGWRRIALDARAGLKYGAGLAPAQPLLALWPRGDGHPLLVFTGPGAADPSPRPLRRSRAAPGRAVQAWGRGRNFGPRDAQLAASLAGQWPPFQRAGWRRFANPAPASGNA